MKYAHEQEKSSGKNYESPKSQEDGGRPDERPGALL